MNRIFANDFYGMLTFAASRLEGEAERVNALNVFPVPDGDTGSNMSMTINGVNGLTLDKFSDLGTVAKAVADLMLRSARGNSGVILSVYFKGLALRLAGLESAGTAELSTAFAAGTEAAYGAVMNPTEGTILSVMRAVSEAACTCDINELEPYFAVLKATAETALLRTPEQLPILKEAGVVDAGGCGFVVILNAMSSAVTGEAEAEGFVVPEPSTAVISAAAASDSEIVYPYCTECIIEKSPEYLSCNAAEPLHEFVLSAGDSAVYVEDESIVKIHVHTSDPGAVLSEATKYGSLLTVKVENMRKQHTELSQPSVQPTLKEDTGFVSVTNGDGLRDIFIDLGVNEVVSGGQTMNPSTEELLAAVKRIGMRTVFILPNNSNIILTANAAAKLAKNFGIDARVIPSKSVPQGITALCHFVDSSTADENEAEMTAALPTVKTVTATHAVRDAVIEGLKIKRGQFIGLVDNRVKRVADSLRDCVEQLAAELRGMNCITAYCGSELTEKEAEEVRDLITESLGNKAEVTVVSGGQPVYALILSGE